MSEVRTGKLPEMPPHELRFTVDDPRLDEALVLFETEGARQADHAKRDEPYADHLPRNLFLFAMKRLEIDQSDEIDGYSQHRSTFEQYRLAMSNLSSHGYKRFSLDPWAKLYRAGGPGGSVNGVGLRLRIDPFSVGTVLSAPFYELEEYRKSMALLDSEHEGAPLARNEFESHSAYIPVRYEIGHTVDNPADALERLQYVLSLGAHVSQLTVVQAYPRAARMRDPYVGSGMHRTYDKLDDVG